MNIDLWFVRESFFYFRVLGMWPWPGGATQGEGSPGPRSGGPGGPAQGQPPPPHAHAGHPHAHATGPGGGQHELSDMMQLLDHGGATTFEELNMFNTNFE